MKKTLQTFTANVSGAVTYNTLGGRPYTVVPMIMAVEGVLNGSTGNMFYPKEELGKLPAAWNHKPVLVYHPLAEGFKGKSGCDPAILDGQGIGLIMNASFADGKLKAEAWLDTDRISNVDSRISDAIAREETLELSTGLWSDVELTSGIWNGKPYDKIARNIVPDHLAVLPDQEGACSIEDGAGFLRLNLKGGGKDALNRVKRLFLLENALSHEEIRDRIQTALNERFPSKTNYLWAERVYDSIVIYEDEDKLFKLQYQSTDDQIVLSGDPVEVVRVVEYRLKDGGTLVSNYSKRKETPMKKEKLVDGLVENASTHWLAEDREFLLTLNEDQLKKMIPVAAEIVPDPPAPSPEKAENVSPTPVPEVPKKPQTVEEYVSNAPTEMREMLSSGLSVMRQQKAAFIESIITNEANTFTKEGLETQSLEYLSAIARLATNGAKTQESVPMFLGQQEVARTTQNVADMEPLVMPEVFPGE